MREPPKPLSLDKASAPPAKAGRGVPKPLTMEPRLTVSAPTPAPGRAKPPAALSLGSGPDYNSLADALVHRSPDLISQRHRIVPRCQIILSATDDELLNWGERNLKAQEEGSTFHFALTKRLTEMNVPTWIDKTTESSCALPVSFFAKLMTPPEKPEFYESRLRQLLPELKDMKTGLYRLIEETRPKIAELSLDVGVLRALADQEPVQFRQEIMLGRAQTLIYGHLNTINLVASAEISQKTVTGHIASMDLLLGVTIPAWKISESARR